MKRAIALVTESTRRDGTRQGFAAPRPVGAPLTEPAPPPKKDRLRGRCPSESSPGSRAPNPDSSHSNWTILWGQVTGNRIANNTVTAGSNGIFAICYNPTPDDPMGPRGDTITGNLLSGFSTGVNLVSTSGNNVFWGNTIVFKNSAWESPNTTNLFQGNVEMQVP